MPIIQQPTSNVRAEYRPSSPGEGESPNSRPPVNGSISVSTSSAAPAANSITPNDLHCPPRHADVSSHTRPAFPEPSSFMIHRDAATETAQGPRPNDSQLGASRETAATAPQPGTPDVPAGRNPLKRDRSQYDSGDASTEDEREPRRLCRARPLARATNLATSRHMPEGYVVGDLTYDGDVSTERSDTLSVSDESSDGEGDGENFNNGEHDEGAGVDSDQEGGGNETELAEEEESLEEGETQEEDSLEEVAGVDSDQEDGGNEADLAEEEESLEEGEIREPDSPEEDSLEEGEIREERIAQVEWVSYVPQEGVYSPDDGVRWRHEDVELGPLY